MKNPTVYIMTNNENTFFYIGVTSDLIKRVWEHKSKAVEGFTKKHNIKKLVYFETMDTMEVAILREKQLKNWHRQWKINLIKENNPNFLDLSDSWEC